MIPSDAIALRASFRAWTEPMPTEDKPKSEKVSGKRIYKKARRPKSADKFTAKPLDKVLIFDTETMGLTAEQQAAQALMFGFYIYGAYTDDGVIAENEGIIYADDLATSYPDGYERLKAYAHTRRANVVGVNYMEFLSRAEFVNRYLYPALRTDTTIVGFNLPFDLSRLAVTWGNSTGEFYGGFSLSFTAADPDIAGEAGNGLPKPHPFKPIIRIKHLSGTKSLIKVSSRSAPDDPTGYKAGRFIDLATLTRALTDRSFSLDRACKRWLNESDGKMRAEEYGRITIPFIDYARQDVTATAKLLHAVLTEFYALGLPINPENALSSASIAKAALRGLGVTPPMERWPDFDRVIFGAAMESFYGGRSEVRIRKTVVPIEALDFTSMYPTVSILTGLWDILTAKDIEVTENTAEIQQLLDRVTVEDMFNAGFWRRLRSFASVKANGDILPVRADYDGSGASSIGVNPLWSDRPTYYGLPDLIASKILTGKTPVIEQAYTLRPIGKLSSLTTAEFGKATVNPKEGNLWRTLIEGRKNPGIDDSTSSFLKCTANSGSYGILAEFISKDRPASKPEMVQLVAGNEVMFPTTNHPEDPGKYCFPPVAALVTASARLMLALLENEITSRGGSWVFADTDSLAPVATEKGGLIPCEGGQFRDSFGRECVKALAYDEIESILEKFDRLNPYDRAVIPHLVKNEYRALCYAISSKRYCSFTGDSLATFEVAQNGKAAKEHGLGHLMNPRMKRDDFDTYIPGNYCDGSTEGESPCKGIDCEASHSWVNLLWRLIIAASRGFESDVETWKERAALRRVSVTAPAILNALDYYNVGRGVNERIRPFSFFMTSYDAGDVDRTLITPFNSDPSQAINWKWFDKLTGKVIPVRIERSRLQNDYGYPEENIDMRDGFATLPSMYAVAHNHPRKTEPKFRAPDGGRVMMKTKGLLRRTNVLIGGYCFIGKESNELNESLAGLESDEPTKTYFRKNEFDLAVSVLRTLDTRSMMEQLCRAEKIRDSARIQRQRELDIRSKRRTRALKQETIERMMVKYSAMERVADDDISPDQFRNIINGVGGVKHTARVENYIVKVASDKAREWIRTKTETEPKGTDFEVMSIYLASVKEAPIRLCGCGCERLVKGRETYATAACRKRVSRLRKMEV